MRLRIDCIRRDHRRLLIKIENSTDWACFPIGGIDYLQRTFLAGVVIGHVIQGHYEIIEPDTMGYGRIKLLPEDKKGYPMSILNIDTFSFHIVTESELVEEAL